jgi:CubicO group peptidase (beta-lactamase class C family)
VSRYVPALVPNGDEITIRQLLNHTSGIPDFEADKRVLAPYLRGNLGYRARAMASASSRYPTACGAAWDTAATVPATSPTHFRAQTGAAKPTWS